MKSKFFLFFYLLIFGFSFVQAQQRQYQFSRSLDGISDEWHRISLPEELFGKLGDDFYDIRIKGITAANDTIEAPYILKSLKDKSIKKEVLFKRINDSKKEGAFYFTFEIPEPEVINEIALDFEDQNLLENSTVKIELIMLH